MEDIKFGPTGCAPFGVPQKETVSIPKKYREPYVGEIVLFTPNPDDKVARSNYNDVEIAAIVTRVWSYGCVNLKIIPDCGPMQDRTSVVHWSLNKAGYHFRFKDERREVPVQITEPSPEGADASTFLRHD